MSNYWQEKFEQTGADGIDFVGLLDTPAQIRQLYDTKTKEEMIAGCGYPRSNYLFWKMVDGQKVYIDNRTKQKPGSVIHHPERKVLYMIYAPFEDEEMWGLFEDQGLAEEICLALTEEKAYFEACDLYQWRHHWDWERACIAGWERVKYDYFVKEVDFWKF